MKGLEACFSRIEAQDGVVRKLSLYSSCANETERNKRGHCLGHMDRKGAEPGSGIGQRERLL